MPTLNGSFSTGTPQAWWADGVFSLSGGTPGYRGLPPTDTQYSAHWNFSFDANKFNPIYQGGELAHVRPINETTRFLIRF